MPATADPADEVPWRHARHWVRLPVPFPALPVGRHVLTLHTVRTGLMNYAYLEVAAS